MDAKIIQLFGDRDAPVTTDDEHEDMTVDELLADIGSVQEELDNLSEYDTVERFWQGVQALKQVVSELPSGP